MEDHVGYEEDHQGDSVLMVRDLKRLVERVSRVFIQNFGISLHRGRRVSINLCERYEERYPRTMFALARKFRTYMNIEAGRMRMSIRHTRLFRSVKRSVDEIMRFKTNNEPSLCGSVNFIDGVS